MSTPAPTHERATPETDALDAELNKLDRFEYEGKAPIRFRELAEKLELERNDALE